MGGGVTAAFPRLIGFELGQRHRAGALRDHALDHLAERLEHRAQRRIRRDLFEYAALAGGDGVAALALRDVGDAGPDEPAVRTRQAHEAHFAGQRLSVRVAVHPLEHRRLTGERAIDVAAREAKGRPVILLMRRTHPLGAAIEQHLARHLEEAAGVVVHVDEPVEVHVEYDDDLGRVLDQRPVARFAVAHGLFGHLPLGAVAHAHDVAVTAVQARLADRNFEGDPGLVLGTTPGLVCSEIDVGVVDGGRAALEEFHERFIDAVHVREQVVERASEDLRRHVAEDPFARGVEGLDVARIIDRDDGVLDVVEDGLQVGGRLLANFAGERLGLIRHDLHGAHDAAPLGLEHVVVAADRREQRPQIELTVAPARFVDLTVEQAVESQGGQGSVAANRSGNIA